MLDMVQMKAGDQIGKGTILMHGENKNGKVLVTQTSELVDLIISEHEDINFLITIDSENLLRTWSVKTSSTTHSYKLPMKKRVTAAAIDPTMTYLAIGNCIGEVQVLNLKSGGILYHLPSCDTEITCLQFLSGMSEFWLVAGCWQGKVMMWTCPNEDNNFTITAKCRIGHKRDILCVDSSSQYIVTGGIDGLVSIWNLFSGILKYAIALPLPTTTGAQGCTTNENDFLKDKNIVEESDSSSDENNSDEDDDSLKRDSMNEESQITNNDKKQLQSKQNKVKQKQSFLNEQTSKVKDIQEEDKAAIKLKRTIVGLCFHPYYANFVCVLQEGGDIHVVDCSNGTIAYEYVAKVKLNSNWACDKDSQKLFVVGDVGKAILLDMSFMKSMLRNSILHSFSAKGKSPLKSNLVNPTAGLPNSKIVKWNALRPWFVAHAIPKMDSAFVVSVKFASHIKVYITATSKGEVKFFSNSNCECLGILNTPNWDPTGLMEIISEVRRENK